MVQIDRLRGRKDFEPGAVITTINRMATHLINQYIRNAPTNPLFHTHIPLHATQCTGRLNEERGEIKTVESG